MLATTLLTAATACDWFEDLRPVEARVSIDGTPGSRVQVITSSRFVAGVNEVGVTQVSVIASDTAWPALPFEAKFQITADQRFLVQLSRFQEDVASVRMRVFVNDDRKFNEGGALLAETPYLFVYTFNQRLTSSIDVVF
jgi:hypothetical protein